MSLLTVPAELGITDVTFSVDYPGRALLQGGQRTRQLLRSPPRFVGTCVFAIINRWKIGNDVYKFFAQLEDRTNFFQLDLPVSTVLNVGQQSVVSTAASTIALTYPSSPFALPQVNDSVVYPNEKVAFVDSNPSRDVHGNLNIQTWPRWYDRKSDLKAGDHIYFLPTIRVSISDETESPFTQITRDTAGPWEVVWQETWR